jgi:elongation factor Ts
VEIKASDVKALRERTGAGMMDCKKALQEAGGDFAKAEKHLKELGLAAAAKRIGRATNEGRVFTKLTDSRAGMIELACETDFVARNTDFIAIGEQIVADVTARNLKQPDAAVEDLVQKARTTIRENIALRRIVTIDAAADETLVEYVHGEGRIGVIVKAKAEKPEAFSNPAVKEFIFNTALHIAAFNPMYLTKDKVDPAYLKEQEEIFTVQAANLGKPANVLAGIVKGKLSKHLAEICLYDQPFVKDDKRTVAQVMNDLGKEIGSKITITDYLYYRVGEDL